MAITNVDALIAGFQPPKAIIKAATPTMVVGRPQSLWGLAGVPGPGSFDTTLAGVALSSSAGQVAGQIPFDDPVSGISYLARFGGSFSVGGHAKLCDRLWHNGGFTITSNTSQIVNSATFPARDEDGLSNGKGVLLGLEISGAAGAAAPTITIGYTNSDGVSGRTATNAFPTANSPTAGAFFPIGLQAGDRGVRSVQSLQISASWVSGTMNLVAYREITAIDMASGNVGDAVDPITGGLPPMYNGSVPFVIVIPPGTGASYFNGEMVVAQG